MSRGRDGLFPSVRSEGAILPPDTLARIADLDPSLGGLTPEDYHLVGGERLNEAASRAWSRAQSLWSGFKAARERLAEGDAGTGLTRERWLLPLFQELGYGRLQRARAVELEGRTYPVSHLWQQLPIHLVGCGLDLDRRTPGEAGAARASPHSLVQELLNRSDAHLWALLSNGLRLRILRDNVSLTRQAYVELDLEAILEGELYADFRLLWLVAHQSRVEAERPEGAWLERWSQASRAQGARALDQLRDGVEAAIVALGRGFLAHPANASLRDRLQTGALDAQDYYRQLLRLVYRLIFLFVAEDRELLCDPHASEAACEIYRRYYSTARLRKLARAKRGDRHGDLYEGLRLVMAKLDAEGSPALALPALGSFLWSKASLADLGEARLANRDLLEALRHLAFVRQPQGLRPVDYRNLGAEELGSVYESLLELHPEIHKEAASFALRTASGHERKTTGSYYTPASLVNELLDSALEPVLAEAARARDPERAILALRVCDPATGSGHFLIAAAHRIAKRLAAVRSGDEEPAPERVRTALRDVAGHCLYGVDLNEMAVELCKVGLWLEAMEPGKPLSFLDHRIRCGNSLLGATPALIAEGLPDEAFKPLTGDDAAIARALKRRNRDEHYGDDDLFADWAAEAPARYTALSARAAFLDRLPDDSLEAAREKERAHRELERSAERRRAKLAADAWCAAFVWPKREGAPPAITQSAFLRLLERPETVAGTVHAEIERLARAHRFFHWHVEFPDVFRVPAPGESAENEAAGWSGGFDVVLGNPPWEHVELKEKEFFATRAPGIAAAATGAARKRLIGGLKKHDATLHTLYLDAKRQHDGFAFLLGQSGRYPLCGRGRINTYAVFAELKRQLLSPTGRVGCIVPSGIATDDTTKHFFGDLVERGSLVSLYDFQSGPGLFGEIGHARYKFCLLTLAGLARPVRAAEFAFFLRSTEHLGEPDRRFSLSAEDIALLNPNTRTCPVFRTRRDAELTKAIYRRVPVLVREGPPEKNPWGVSFRQGLFNMTSDSHLFRTREQLESDGWLLEGNHLVRDRERMMPLYEAKMVHHFDHRFGDYALRPERSQSTALPEVPPERLRDPAYRPLPRYWVPEAEVEARLAERWPHGWLLGWRDITNATNERTVIASVIPRVGVGNNLPISLLRAADSGAATLVANISSLVLDFVARFKVGGTHLNFFITHQLAMLSPNEFASPSPWNAELSLRDWLLPRVLELTYTAWDLAPFARDLGYDGPPFRWDEARRFLLRCELDAAFFHLYLGDAERWQREGSAELLAAFPSPRDAVDHVLESFPIVKRKDLKQHGDYRTKETLLHIYDEMAAAAAGGDAYRTPLDPPPADPRAAHLPAGGRRAEGAAYELADLLHADLAGEVAAVRLADGEAGGETASFRFLTDDDPPPEAGEVVIVRHPALRRGDRPVGVAAGRLAISRQRDMASGEPVVVVTLAGGADLPARLRLTEAEWRALRPLAVRVD